MTLDIHPAYHHVHHLLSAHQHELEEEDPEEEEEAEVEADYGEAAEQEPEEEDEDELVHRSDYISVGTRTSQAVIRGVSGRILVPYGVDSIRLPVQNLAEMQSTYEFSDYQQRFEYDGDGG